MGILDRFKKSTKPTVRTELVPAIPSTVAVENVVTSINVPKVISWGRQSQDATTGLFGEPTNLLLPPPTHEDDWRSFTLDSESFQRVPPDRVLELLTDLSPEVSKALWDYLRMCNAGFDFDVYNPGTKTRHLSGYRLVQETLDNWAITGSSLDTVFARMNISAFMRGAIFTESVYDSDGKTSIELATPDPISARFRRVVDPQRGKIWQLGQMQGGQFVPLVAPTVLYLPIDPHPASPYGRPIAAPAIFTGLFLLGLLHDLRRVVAQQGYPRMDISIDTDVLLKLAPPDVRSSSEKLQIWIDGIISQIRTVYSALEPTDAYIHISAIKVNKNVGAVDTESLGSISGIIQALERMSIRALKTMPLLMAVMEGASDANSNRQWEIDVQGIKAIQHLGEYTVNRHLKINLQANSIQATPVFRFAELRSSEALRDAQTEVLNIQNATNKYLMGWWNQEEASLDITGETPARPTPLVWPNGVTGEPPSNPNDVVSQSDGNPSDPITTKNQVVSFRRPDERKALKSSN